MVKWWKCKQNSICFLAGLGVILLSVVPNMFLGLDSIFTYHDQLDGELIAYILQGRYFFEENLPSFMGGSSKTALTLPAPIFVLFFLGENSFAGLFFMLLLGRLVGFIGMYLLVKESTGYPLIGTVAGVMYGMLPFLEVYGFSQFGIPLLIWCVLQIREKKFSLWSYIYVAIYGLASSLVLVGFGILGMGLLWLLWDVLMWKQGRRERNRVVGFATAWGILFLIYVVENGALLLQMLDTSGKLVSHKAEYVLQATPFVSTFMEKLLQGGQHSEGYQKLLVPAGIAVAAAAISFLLWQAVGTRRKSDEARECTQALHRLLSCMLICLGCNVLFAFCAAVWSVEPVVELRNKIGALGAFQLERLLWIAPCLWYLFGACAVAILVRIIGQTIDLGERVVYTVFLLGMLAVVAVTGIQVLLNGDFKSNIQKLRNAEYGVLSFRDYYAIGVLEQVETFLRENEGRGQSEYRVVSLGIDPAAALYHGFYCLDGYSNNYSLEYKHAFRKVIAPELAKSEYLQEYFDEWGNRCYLFSAEVPGYYTIEKNGFYFQDYQLDVSALKELGGDYLLSAAYIMDAAEQGLKLLHETPFETEGSYYRIFVYEICR